MSAAKGPDVCLRIPDGPVIVGYSNLLAHRYATSDRRRVYEVATTQVTGLLDVLDTLLAKLPELGAPGGVDCPGGEVLGVSLFASMESLCRTRWRRRPGHCSVSLHMQKTAVPRRDAFQYRDLDLSTRSACQSSERMEQVSESDLYAGRADATNDARLQQDDWTACNSVDNVGIQYQHQSSA